MGLSEETIGVQAVVRIRPLAPADLAAGRRLSDQAGWNQTDADWARLLAWEPAGCLVAERAGEVIGTVTTTTHGARLAWIGMMLVDVAQRGQGVGRALLSQALDCLERDRGVETVALDATPLGQPLYESLGFATGPTLQRYDGIGPARTALTDVRRLARAAVARAAALDVAVFGADRARILRDLVTGHPEGCFVVETSGRLRGYACSRPGARGWYVGPLVASDAEAAAMLWHAALAPLAGRPVVVDVLDANADARRLVEADGFRPRRRFTRMARGGSLPPHDFRCYYAIAGPEIG